MLTFWVVGGMVLAAALLLLFLSVGGREGGSDVVSETRNRRPAAFRRDRSIAIGLALLLGGLGVHKFYLGRPGLGLFCLAFVLAGIPFFGIILPFILPVLFSWVEGIALVFTSDAEFDAIYN